MSEKKNIKVIVANGPETECTLEIVPGVPWRLHLSGASIGTQQAEGEDAFEALQRLRSSLDERGIAPLCNGARIDVFPSGMSRSMSAGRKAYVTKLGAHPGANDIVDIFEPTERHLVGTVAQQAQFRTAWVQSIAASTASTVRPLPGEVDEARRTPNGWVYRIAGPFGRDAAIPPEAIVGAWRVDPSGKIVGEFIQNAKYDPEKWPSK